ncbi:MAG: hypothetical protein GF346_02420 [Candidatus Eisenbacteria bacterium]|nr:hypothetical protein [Candidatus Latescibacterota bacterium]MBD3301283.1 hypothetical protein [Candidatus Eisenbacteria bacterium]
MRLMIEPVRFRPALLLLALCLAPMPAFAQDAGTPQEGPRLTPEQEATAERIFSELVSPCCWTTTVDVHGSGAAPRIQAEVRRMLAGGMSYQEIIDHYVDEYGERILAKPKRTGFNLAAYWVPYLALLAGAILLLIFIRRGTRRRSRAISGPTAPIAPEAEAPPPVPGSDEDYKRRIEEELRRTS